MSDILFFPGNFRILFFLYHLKFHNVCLEFLIWLLQLFVANMSYLSSLEAYVPFQSVYSNPQKLFFVICININPFPFISFLLSRSVTVVDTSKFPHFLFHFFLSSFYLLGEVFDSDFQHTRDFAAVFFCHSFLTLDALVQQLCFSRL